MGNKGMKDWYKSGRPPPLNSPPSTPSSHLERLMRSFSPQTSGTSNPKTRLERNTVNPGRDEELN